jgi:hypothetical protein
MACATTFPQRWRNDPSVQVRETIRSVRPDAIMVELDESRVSPNAAPGLASREPTSLWEIVQREAFRSDASVLDRIRSAEVICRNMFYAVPTCGPNNKQSIHHTNKAPRPEHPLPTLY